MSGGAAAVGIVTRRLTLLPLRADALSLMLPIEQAIRPHRDEAAQRDSLSRWAVPGEAPCGMWRIVLAGATVGRVGLDWPSGHAGPELSYALVPTARGRGLAAEAAAAVIGRAFAFGGVGVVRAVARRDNVASIAVMRRLGMTPCPGDNAEVAMFETWRQGRPYLRR